MSWLSIKLIIAYSLSYSKMVDDVSRKTHEHKLTCSKSAIPYVCWSFLSAHRIFSFIHVNRECSSGLTKGCVWSTSPSVELNGKSDMAKDPTTMPRKLSTRGSGAGQLGFMSSVKTKRRWTTDTFTPLHIQLISMRRTQMFLIDFVFGCACAQEFRSGEIMTTMKLKLQWLLWNYSWKRYYNQTGSEGANHVCCLWRWRFYLALKLILNDGPLLLHERPKQPEPSLNNKDCLLCVFLGRILTHGSPMSQTQSAHFISFINFILTFRIASTNSQRHNCCFAWVY